MRSRRHVAVLGVVVLAGLAACTDATTSSTRMSPTGVRMNISVSRTAADAHSLRVVAQYARASAPTVLRPVDSATVSLTAGTTTTVAVLLDIGPCLQDPERQRPQSGSSGDKSCVLHLTLTLYDATMHVIDQSSLTPITATLGEPASTPEAVLGPRPLAANALALGPAHTCALNEAGLLYCWGQNAFIFGTGDADSSLTPRLSGGGMRFTQIDASGSSMCGLTLDRSVYCWGAGPAARPSGTGDIPAAPIAVAPNLKFQSIAVGLLATCGIEYGTGTAYCWGNNRSAMLGVGDTLPRTTPSRVNGNLQFRTLRTAIFATCGLTSATPAQVYCWGTNQQYRIINPNVAPNYYTVPTLIQLPANVTPVVLSVGVSNACILTTTGAMYCWGTDLFGNTAPGNGTRLLPAANLAATPALAGISLGRENSFLGSYGCGWTTDGTAHCWGSNSQGQLGSESSTSTCVLSTTISFPCANVPFPAATSVKFVSVVTGQEHTCGISTGHQLYCWGLNRNGQLGNGSTTSSATPQRAAATIRTP